MINKSDIELAKLIRFSDHDAFEAIYDQYCEPLYHYLWSRLGHADAAQEFLQDIFIRLWQSRERLHPKKNLKSYIYRIANNLIIDNYRRQKVRIRFKERKREVCTETIGEDTELKIHLKMAIQNLPEKWRTVFILHHIKKYTYEEIALMCKVSKKTIEYRMKKAIFLLQKNLDGP